MKKKKDERRREEKEEKEENRMSSKVWCCKVRELMNIANLVIGKVELQDLFILFCSSFFTFPIVQQ